MPETYCMYLQGVGTVTHMDTRTQAACHHCGRLVALHADGTLYTHGPTGHHCHGSHQAPPPRTASTFTALWAR